MTFFFASPSSDKTEDCFSHGLMSWIIIGLIIFAISCACFVVACCLKNKVSKYMRWCRSILPKVMDGELDLMRFKVGQAHTHSACAVFFGKKTELLIYHWNSSH